MNVLNFIKENWKLILEIVVLLVSVVMFIIRKKPVKVVDTLKQTICAFLPGIITVAESSGLKGEDKLKYAIDLLYKVFVKDYLTREEFDNKYLSFVKSQIEAILSTPQKKGDLHV